MAVTGADKSSLSDSQPRQSLAHAFPQSSRSPSGFPERFSGRIRGNNIPKLCPVLLGYLHACRSSSVKPPKADIGTQSWNVRFVPKADIAKFIRSTRRRGAKEV